jgi:hypothetical protein
LLREDRQGQRCEAECKNQQDKSALGLHWGISERISLKAAEGVPR